MDDLFKSINDYLENPPIDDKASVLEEDEVEILILSLAKGRGEEGFTEEEALAVVNWAALTRINEALLNLVLRGFAQIGWQDNEPTFQITDQGTQSVKEYKNGLN